MRAQPALAAALLLTAALVGTPAVKSQQAPVREFEEAFGFQVGEERRYVLGPPEIMQPGEYSRWRIRLERLAGESPDQRAIFVLEHELAQFSRGAAMTEPSVHAELTVNQFGFPLEMKIQRDRQDPTTLAGRHDVRLTFTEGYYLVETPQAMGRREFRLHVPRHDDFDPSRPKGIFISHRENPGLLSLPLTVLLAEGGAELEYQILTPSLIDGPGRRTRFDSTYRPGFSNWPPLRFPQDDREIARGRLELKESTIIEIAGRKMDALRLNLNLAYGDIYVQPDGLILKMEATFRRRTGWIRLLLPSEY